MDSLQDNKISYETPDFTNVTFEPKEDTSNHNPLEEEFKKTKEENIENEKDPKIKIILEKIQLTEDAFEIIELCSQIELLDPKYFRADLDKAEAYVKLEHVENAEKYFKNAIKKSDGKSDIALSYYGYFLETHDRYEEALDYFNQALKINGGNGLVWDSKGP